MITNRQPQLRATSFDVAERAGVSQSTVSRALADSKIITEATRERVRRAAQELGYLVDERAARLRSGRTGALAVVLIGREDEAASDLNPFYYSLLGSVCAAASRRGFETLVSFQSGVDNFFGQYAEKGQADALVVIGTSTNEEGWKYFRGLAEDGRSLAFWGSPYDELDWVRSDNFEGGQIAADQLFKNGCRDLVFIGAIDSPQQQFRERYEGFADMAVRRGLKPRLQSVDESLSREEQGRQAIAALLAEGRAFDGLFAACDAIALGAMAKLRECGVDVPGKCGIIGFDGIAAGIHSSPSLTSIAPDFEVAGSMLVERALAKVDGASENKSPQDTGPQDTGPQDIGPQDTGEGDSDEGDQNAPDRRVPVQLLARGSTRN